jgi:hypothetical protein
MDGSGAARQPVVMNAFLVFHVALSLVGILSGFVVVFGMIGSQSCPGWTKVFLWTTLATSLTGFLFPFHGFTPAIGTGIISVLVLALTFYALYVKKLFGGWRRVYVVTAVIALYLNFFVLIVQSFLKISALHALAPTQKEPPFGIAQGVALLAFIVLGIVAAKKFHPVAPRA